MTSAPILRPIEILLVENNPVDIRIVQDAFKNSLIPNNISVASDGEAATDFLCRRGTYGNVPKPDLIILDLSIPKKDGRAVLEEIKANGNLKLIPVIVLSTSNFNRDIVNAYTNQASCYVVKPLEFDHFAEAVNALKNFWLNFVKFPSD